MGCGGRFGTHAQVARQPGPLDHRYHSTHATRGSNGPSHRRRYQSSAVDGRAGLVAKHFPRRGLLTRLLASGAPRSLREQHEFSGYGYCRTQRAVERALLSESTVRRLRRLVMLGCRPQFQFHVDAPDDQNLLLDLHFSCHPRDEPVASSRDSARLQRAPKGPEESTAGRRHHVVECGGMRLERPRSPPVMRRYGSMRAEQYGLGLGWQVSLANRAGRALDENLGTVDDVGHGAPPCEHPEELGYESASPYCERTISPPGPGDARAGLVPKSSPRRGLLKPA